MTTLNSNLFSINPKSHDTADLGQFKTRQASEKPDTATFSGEVDKILKASHDPAKSLSATPPVSKREKPPEKEPGHDRHFRINVDLNDDGIVNSSDLGMQLGATGQKDMRYDHNKDGVVDDKDIDVLLSFFGTSGKARVSNPDLDGNGMVDGGDLGIVLGSFGEENGAGDINNDGNVNQSDLDLLLAFWGQQYKQTA
jgi:hypothetical protein